MAHIIQDENGSLILIDQWCVDDIQALREDLSKEQCELVLETIAQNHDANIGIHWEFIQYIADELYPLDEVEE
jgi:hypothetical protein